MLGLDILEAQFGMTRGRKLGQSEIKLDQMSKIARLTEKGMSRGEIAKDIGCCKKTVYNWQLKLGII